MWCTDVFAAARVVTQLHACELLMTNFILALK